MAKGDEALEAETAGVEESGMYELSVIVLHKGMELDGGHYIGWVRHGLNKWLKFDDDRVSLVSDAEVAKLDGKGGGDWHIAYVLLYAHKLRDTHL
jgi:ubiquitin carboxyl-terminal hydrolase 14